MATEYGLTLSWSWAYRVMTLEYELAKSWPLSMGSTCGKDGVQGRKPPLEGMSGVHGKIGKRKRA
eukprot:scaffold238917_cov24-Tisochrysis_lutea.AAC.1